MSIDTFVAPVIVAIFFGVLSWGAKAFERRLASVTLFATGAALVVLSLTLIADDHLGRMLDRMAYASALLYGVSYCAYFGMFWWLSRGLNFSRNIWLLAMIIGCGLVATLGLYVEIQTECSMGNCL